MKYSVSGGEVKERWRRSSGEEVVTRSGKIVMVERGYIHHIEEIFANISSYPLMAKV